MSAGLWLGVAVLGAVGALGRVRLDELVRRRGRAVVPSGILVVNLLGSLGLGLLTGLDVSARTLLLVGGGLLGAFTTFSTWMLQTVRLPPRLALANLAVSVAGGLAAAALGWALGAVLR